MIDIRQEYLLPLPFRIFGYTLLAVGSGMTVMVIIRLFVHGEFSWELPGGIIIGLLGGITALSHYRLMIDTKNRAFKVTTWILGFRRGIWEEFDHVEKIYINRVLQSTTISSYTGHPNTVKEYLFKAFLKMNNGEKVHLDTDKAEQQLQGRVDAYRKSLGRLYRGE